MTDDRASDLDDRETATLPAIGDVPIPAERRAHLAPLLRALLDDFARLAEMERADLEPSTVFRPGEGVGDERG